MKNFTVQTTLLGQVTDVNPEKSAFVIKCRSGDEFIVNTGQNTQFQFLTNFSYIEI